MKGQSFTLLSVLVCLFLSAATYAQTVPPQTYYVVVGAFAKVDNAVRYTAESNQKGFTAQYSLNESRGLYYVYILETQERRRAFSFMLKMRAETQYKDAWVFIGTLGPTTTVEEKPVAEEPAEQPVEQEPEPVIEEPVTKEPEPVVDSTTTVTPVVEEKAPEGKPFLFQLTSGESGNEVMGEVHIQETANASQYQSFSGNEVVYLKAPRNSEGTYLAIVQAPGYKQARVLVDFKDPSAIASGIGPKNESIVPIQLTRSSRGDYIEFNNVRFFRNSAIFEPQSKNELDGLVDLLKEESKYKIRVHAHCNGKNSRDITAMGDSKDFFATNSFNKRETASDKRLTELRANLVKRYLVENGISEKRIKTKAEGGRVMIYPQTSTLANYNDRIEIEIMKGK